MLLWVAFFLSGCQESHTALPASTQTISTSTPFAATITSVSPTPIPQATVTPTISPVTGPSLILADTHSKISYVSPITVQHVTGETVICSFELDHLAEGHLFYWSKNEGMQSVKSLALPNETTQQVIEIRGLLPGEEYEIAVGLLDENGSYLPPRFSDSAWDPIRVRTLRKEMWPLLVGVFGDSGFGDSITYELAERMAAYDLDFVLHTGDIVYNVSDNKSVQEAFALKYFQPLSPILKQFPIYPVPGNHEYYEDAEFQDRPYYFHVFPLLSDFQIGDFEGGEHRKWYALELEPIQILMLDTQLFWRGEGRAAQTAWLLERLNDDRFQATIPIFHVPPFTSGRHQNDGRFVQTDWLPLFEDSLVPLVISGHDHNYERLILNDITYIVTGGGSIVLYPMGIPVPHSQYFAQKTHFVLLELHPDHVILSAITPEGETLDKTVIEY